MKMIRIAVLIGLAAVSSACAEENEAVKKDLALMQGEWSMVSGSADGQAMPDQMRKQMKAERSERKRMASGNDI